MFEGAESLQNILASDLIPKLKLLHTCGGQEQDSRHGGLKNHDDYEDSTGRFIGPLLLPKNGKLPTDLLYQVYSRIALISILRPILLVRTLRLVTPCFPRFWLGKYGLCHHKANAEAAAEIL